MLFQKGIILNQKKEPAFSNGICEFLNSSISKEYFDDWEKPENPDVDSLIQCAQKAGIIDESDGTELYKKLITLKSRKCVCIVADAIDDEPYISSQMAVAFWMGKEMTDGLKLIQEAGDVPESYIAFYRHLGEIKVKLPNEIEGIEVRFISGRYPAERRAKRKLASKGALVIGSCALVHLNRAYNEKRKQTSVFLTVGGNSVSNPMNLEVSIGMTVDHLLEKCGLSAEPGRVVINGTMKGISIIDTEKTVVSQSTMSVLAFKEKRKEDNFNCIGCGRCTKYCPMGLSPHYIYKFIKAGAYDKLERFDVTDCIGCGVCSYRCPAKLELSDTIFNYAQETREKNKSSKNSESQQIKFPEKESPNKVVKNKGKNNKKNKN